MVCRQSEQRHKSETRLGKQSCYVGLYQLVEWERFRAVSCAFFVASAHSQRARCPLRNSRGFVRLTCWIR